MKLKPFAIGALALALAVFLVTPSSLHNISYANLNPWVLQTAVAAAADSPADAKLKAALQKRLLVADPTLLAVGPPASGPLSGMSQRNVTISNGQGQKVELKYFTTGGSTDKGLLVHEFAAFDIADPWQRASVKSLHLDDRATLGPASAPVTIIEFADFECPYCARAFSEIETVVNTTYKNKVRLVWKNFPLPSHDWAEQAAIAAECARQQNPAAFWTFAGSFYQDQSEINPQNLRDHIERYASASSLDVKALNACVLTDAAEAKVKQDRKDGEGIQINSTPTFLVNGVVVVGLPTSNVFDFVITSQLADKNGSR
ncbi:MAG: DsbA family protein [Candidatus Binataceae bacterium]